MLASFLLWLLLFTVQDCIDQFLNLLRLTPLLFHTLLTLLSRSFCPSEPPLTFLLVCLLLFSIFTFPRLLGSSLTKTNTTTHVQQVLPSLFSTVMHFWHSAIYSHCTNEIALVTSASLNDVVFIYIFANPCLLLLSSLCQLYLSSQHFRSLAFTTPSSLLPFDRWGFLFHSHSPWKWKSQQAFSLLPLPADQYPVMLAAFCISDVCIYPGLCIHPVLHFSHCVFLGKCLSSLIQLPRGCCWTSEEPPWSATLVPLLCL